MNISVLEYILGALSVISFGLSSFMVPNHRGLAKMYLIVAIALTVSAVSLHMYIQYQENGKQQEKLAVSDARKFPLNIPQGRDSSSSSVKSSTTKRLRQNSVEKYSSPDGLLRITVPKERSMPQLLSVKFDVAVVGVLGFILYVAPKNMLRRLYLQSSSHSPHSMYVYIDTHDIQSSRPSDTSCSMIVPNAWGTINVHFEDLKNDTISIQITYDN